MKRLKTAGMTTWTTGSAQLGPVRGITVALLGLLLLVLVTCSAGTPPPQLSESTKSLAITQIEWEPDVIESAINQAGRDLSLVIVVAPGTSETRAQQLGDNFTRLVKTLGPESNPGREIGEGSLRLMTSSLAISRLPLPVAIRRRTSTSRWLKPSG